MAKKDKDNDNDTEWGDTLLKYAIVFIIIGLVVKHGWLGVFG